MALEEVTFYNTDGEEISISNLVNQMINYYLLKREVGETVLTDFNEGSEVRNLMEVFAVGIYALLDEQHEATQIAFISTSHDGYLDNIGELPFINLPRTVGDYAVGEVTFTLAEAQTTQTVVPAGTMIASESTGIEYVTDDDCIIETGELSETVGVTCMTVGEDGNAGSNTINLIVDTIIDTNLISVNNSEALGGGTDYEDDDEYRERLLANVRADGFGTVGWYISLCENIVGVHDVLLVDEQGYTKKVLVNGTVKPTPATILLDVFTELSNISNHVLNHSFTVDVPEYQEVDLDISLDVTALIPEEDLLENLTACIDGLEFDRMEYAGLKIGETLTRNIVSDACAMFGDVVSVTSILYDGSEMSEITPDTDTVLKLGTVNFTQNEV